MTAAVAKPRRRTSAAEPKPKSRGQKAAAEGPKSLGAQLFGTAPQSAGPQSVGKSADVPSAPRVEWGSMVRNLLRLVLVAAFGVMLSPVWLPYLVQAAAWVADRPDRGRTAAVAQRDTAASNTLEQRGRTTVLTADPRGHFLVEAAVNGRPIGVMVDTGATSVALRAEDAAQLGLRPMPADFTVPIATANGTTRAARVTLAEIRIGDVRVKGVEALVVPEKALGTNLLGMSFMRRLSKVEMAGGRLVLRE